MTQSNRIDATFARLREAHSKAFVAYLSAGDPHLSATPEFVYALERAGADIIELGVPFSDPLADGIVNQLAAARAIEAGTTLAGIFETIRVIRAQSQVPLVLFTYFNPVFHHGVEKFFQSAGEAGADGVLLLDLPPEELGAEALNDAVRAAGMHRISLIAPTTPAERIALIAKDSAGFIYYVSREGVTGVQNTVSTSIGEKVAAIRGATNLPICVGFGISTPDQARAVAGIADGVVIGSALVSQIAKVGNAPDAAAQLEAYARPLAEAIHQPASA